MFFYIILYYIVFLFKRSDRDSLLVEFLLSRWINHPCSFLNSVAKTWITQPKVINNEYANFSHGRASPSISDTPRCWSPSCVRGLSTRPVSFVCPSGWKRFFFLKPFLIFFFLDPPPPPGTLTLSVARLQMRKSMHHFSPALRSDIDKSGCYGTASPLVRWLELHWCPTALFSSPERGAAGMDLQDKCGCVCARESSGTKRPFERAEGMEKVSIMRTSNQSKTKAHMKKIPSLWWRNCIFVLSTKEWSRIKS